MSKSELTTFYVRDFPRDVIERLKVIARENKMKVGEVLEHILKENEIVGVKNYSVDIKMKVSSNLEKTELAKLIKNQLTYDKIEIDVKPIQKNKCKQMENNACN